MYYDNYYWLYNLYHYETKFFIKVLVDSLYINYFWLNENDSSNFSSPHFMSHSPYSMFETFFFNFVETKYDLKVYSDSYPNFRISMRWINKFINVIRKRTSGTVCVLHYTKPLSHFFSILNRVYMKNKVLQTSFISIINFLDSFILFSFHYFFKISKDNYRFWIKKLIVLVCLTLLSVTSEVLHPHTFPLLPTLWWMTHVACDKPTTMWFRVVMCI